MFTMIGILRGFRMPVQSCQICVSAKNHELDYSIIINNSLMLDILDIRCHTIKGNTFYVEVVSNSFNKASLISLTPVGGSNINSILYYIVLYCLFIVHVNYI